MSKINHKSSRNFKDVKKASFTLCFLGVICCLPWNFYMSAYDYYQFSLSPRNPNNNNNNNDDNNDSRPPDLSTCAAKVTYLDSHLNFNVRHLQKRELVDADKKEETIISDAQMKTAIPDNFENENNGNFDSKVIETPFLQNNQSDIVLTYGDFCRCINEKQISGNVVTKYGNTDAFSVEVYGWEFDSFTMGDEKLRNEVYEKFYNASFLTSSPDSNESGDREGEQSKNDGKNGSLLNLSEDSYLKFWNSALSFFTMGTMLLSSIVSNSNWLLKNFDLDTRIVKSNMISAICLCITIIMIYWSLDLPVFFLLTLVVVIAVNLTTGVFQTAMFQFCPSLDESLFGAFIAGQACSGVFANVVGIMTNFLVPPVYNFLKKKDESGNGSPNSDEQIKSLEATIFFSIAVAAVIAGIKSWRSLKTFDIINFYTNRDRNDSQNSCAKNINMESEQFTADNKAVNTESGDSSNRDSRTVEGSTGLQIEGPMNISPEPLINIDVESNSTTNKTGNSDANLSKLQIIFYSKSYYFSIWLCYAVTLSLFPSIVAETKSSNFFNSGKTDACGLNLFHPLFLKIFVFLCFNLGDFAGRQYVNFFNNLFFIDNQNNKSGFKCLRLAFCRLGFFVFYMCNVTGTQRYSLFSNDIIFALLMFLFGASNGYLSTKAFVYAPEVFEDSNTKIIAGGLNVTFLTLGLLSGAAFSFVTKKVLLGIQKEVEDGIIEDVVFRNVYQCYQSCQSAGI